MARIVGAVPFALLVAGCYGWPGADSDLQVFNETDAAAGVGVALFAEDGGLAHGDTVSVGPHSMAEGAKVKAPAGTHRIEARSGGQAASETHSLGRETPAVKVHVTAGGLDIRVSTA